MATATKKKADKAKASKTVRLGFVIDESGSMGHLRQSVIDGYNEFVGALKGEDNASNVFSTCGVFDASGKEPTVRFKHEELPLPEVAPFTLDDYQPRGSTPLHDAVAEVIGKLDAQSVEGERVMVVVMTDGYENASREIKPGELRKLVQDREAAGWEFIYMGANVDSFEESRNLGLSGKAGSYLNFTPSASGTANTMKTAGMRTAGYVGENSVVAQSTYSRSAGATPMDVSPDSAEFAAQEAKLLAAQEEAKARAEEEFKAAEKKRQEATESALDAARNMLRGER